MYKEVKEVATLNITNRIMKVTSPNKTSFPINQNTSSIPNLLKRANLNYEEIDEWKGNLKKAKIKYLKETSV